MAPDPPYQLLDLGGGARLERFGERIVDRPHPAALGSRQDVEAWRTADLRFDRDRGWTGPAADAGPWPIELDGLTLELRLTDAGQLGLFPEHVEMLPWLLARVAEASAAARAAAAGMRPAVLHLFAYSGLTTLGMARAGAAVTHLDASRPTVAWARWNAALSGLADRPIRWIVDDALRFTRREARRARHYAGIVLDPPSYGHGPDAGAWRLDEDLPALLAVCAEVLQPDGFVLLSAHTAGFDGGRLADSLGRAMAKPAGHIDCGELALITDDGRRLELGAFARWPGGA